MTAVLTLEDFTVLVRDELGLPLSDSELDHDLDRVPGWDSLQLLRLVSALERHTGQRVALGSLLEARSLSAIHRLAAQS
ncbi:acyl carrier protein [Kitasatospora herbaricolor]|uniref:Acyl carrier protein n=1 Tax=Kitasatospora herbaricolor TaxID=68217 RepID=A0ABZ1W9L7_9ACTN|nr:acyl carrier protein [Kitasatospora herbaricolor]